MLWRITTNHYLHEALWRSVPGSAVVQVFSRRCCSCGSRCRRPASASDVSCVTFIMLWRQGFTCECCDAQQALLVVVLRTLSHIQPLTQVPQLLGAVSRGSFGGSRNRNGGQARAIVAARGAGKGVLPLVSSWAMVVSASQRV